ncbi:MAG: nucleotidyl transferase AbiEii/AbiGii toxin family protein [Sphaerochaetaceae bacterium]
MENITSSTLARLKNKSKDQGVPFQQLLNLFCQEEFIRRLSESNYRESLILKGGYLLYSISRFTTRTTIDADYLLNNYSNELHAIEKLVKEIISQPSKNGFIEFQIRSLYEISEAKEYHGVRVNLIGNIGTTRTPFSIDFGVGDVIEPSPVLRTLPVLLQEFVEPTVLTYSLESTVAEKIDAIISLMEATSRMKDFYDIYYLAITFDFEGRTLQKAIFRTLSNRGTPYKKDSIAVIGRLANDTQIKKRWDNFCKKVLKYNLDFIVVINTIIDFTLLPYQAIFEESEFFGSWSYRDRKYV